MPLSLEKTPLPLESFTSTLLSGLHFLINILYLLNSHRKMIVFDDFPWSQIKLGLFEADFHNNLTLMSIIKANVPVFGIEIKSKYLWDVYLDMQFIDFNWDVLRFNRHVVILLWIFYHCQITTSLFSENHHHHFERTLLWVRNPFELVHSLWLESNNEGLSIREFLNFLDVF